MDDVINFTAGFIAAIVILALWIDHARRRFSSDPATRNSVRDPNKYVRVSATHVKSTPKMLVLDFDVRKNVYIEKRLMRNLSISGGIAHFEIPYRYLISNHLSATAQIAG